MERVLFFDGYCSLCNSAVDTLMRWDRSGRLKYASLQGETASRLLSPSIRGTGTDPQSVIYFREGLIFERSSAIVHVLDDIGGVYKFLAWAIWVFPAPLRDLVYCWIARARYAVFGKRDTCRIPSAEERDRILP